jgi:hypothetical protein
LVDLQNFFRSFNYHIIPQEPSTRKHTSDTIVWDWSTRWPYPSNKVVQRRSTDHSKWRQYISNWGCQEDTGFSDTESRKKTQPCCIFLFCEWAEWVDYKKHYIQSFMYVHIFTYFPIQWNPLKRHHFRMTNLLSGHWDQIMFYIVS